MPTPRLESLVCRSVRHCARIWAGSWAGAGAGAFPPSAVRGGRCDGQSKTKPMTEKNGYLLGVLLGGFSIELDSLWSKFR